MTVLHLVEAVLFVTGAAALLLCWLWLAERITARVPRRRRRAVLGTLWLAPALASVTLYLVWPLVNTVVLSLRDATSRHWAGVANYRYLRDDAAVHSALRNNVLWLVLLTGVCLTVGLLVATLADRVRYEAIAKAVVVLPTAIPFVAGAVIWRFMYQYQPPGLPQTGTVNAVWTQLTGAAPLAWLVDTRTNNVALVAVGIWMSTGFATVILSAALKSIPPELRDAARVDGAGAWQVFRYVSLPHLRPTIIVTTTLLAITAFKAFDIVYVMTNGNFDTDVIANLMYRQLFVDRNYGHASAIAVLLAAVAVPILLLNARATRPERETP
jgi:alpha-glucoside transport system permease protein